ncbi:MAG TPA: hypothetical protein VHE35_27130 [Kofleriaceae bacterium]|nr:hypothetical protein [Kofleriaceae bacterium]
MGIKLASLALCSSLALVTGLAACGDDGGTAGPADAGVDARLEGFDQPDDVCPGAAHCASTGDGQLLVGAAAKVFTPVITEHWTDENGDSEWEPEEPYDDANHNGKFDAYWLFGGGRAANGVHSDLEARAVVFREGDVTVALVYVDAIGLLAGDIDQIRNDPSIAAMGIDHVIVGSIHAHDAVDTIGLWGQDALTSGYNPDFNARLRQAALDAIHDAVGGLQPAQLEIGSTLLLNTPGDRNSRTDHWNKDIRDPVIFDPTMTVARFVKVGSPETTIATVVNWADHPEMSAFGPDNLEISSHYVHYLRDAIEHGITTDQLPRRKTSLAGVGGVTVFVQGALGGQIGSIRGAPVPGPDGTPIVDVGHPKEEALGLNLGERALELLRDEAESVSDLPLSYRSATFHARVDNVGFQVAFIIHLLAPHAFAGYDPQQAIGPTNTPWLPMSATYLQVGPLAIVTCPGELHPELWVGGYDGSWSWGWPIMDATKPNAPDLSTAPQGPYLRDLVLANPGVRYPVLAGLAQDYVGYIVPAYNYVLDPVSPYIEEADGDHYEETYSLGPDVEHHVVDPIMALVAYRP